MQTVISSSFPTQGGFVLTMLLSLNTWLAKKNSFSTEMNFLDNFNLFWNCGEHFRPNSIELGWIGTKVLRDNYLFSLNRPTSLGPDTHSGAVQSEQGEHNKNSVAPKHLPPHNLKQRWCAQPPPLEWSVWRLWPGHCTSSSKLSGISWWDGDCEHMETDNIGVQQLTFSPPKAEDRLSWYGGAYL